MAGQSSDSLVGEVPSVSRRLGCLGESTAGLLRLAAASYPWTHHPPCGEGRGEAYLGRVGQPSGWSIFEGDPLLSGELPQLPPLERR